MSNKESADYPGTQASGPQPPKTLFENTSVVATSLIIIFGILASTLPQPQVLGSIPLNNILKNELHESPDITASFIFWVGLFWYFKPFTGLLTDAFPLFRTRRRYYLLFSSVLACAAWILLGVLPHTYSSLLYGCLFLSLFMVMMSTVTGAVLVEVGQARGATGRLTAVRQVTSNACSLVSGPLGGLLAAGAFSVVAGVNAALVLSIFPIAYFFLREKPEAVTNLNAFNNAGIQLRTMFRSPPFWLAIIFIALYYFAPGINTITFYRQQDVMHMNTEQQGILGAVSGGGGVLAALLYGGIARRVPMRLLLFAGILTAGAGTFLYYFYSNYQIGFPIDFQNGFFGGFAEVALIDLAARATPAGCEGLGYSCILSVRNLSLFGANKLGAQFAHQYHWSWNTMVSLNGGTTLLVLILIPFMPRLLMGSRDGNKPNTENTGEPSVEGA